MTRCRVCNLHSCICNETVPINPTNLFGSPFDCKIQIRTRRFASPNSQFPQDELDDLQTCIRAVNYLLRSLGSKSDPNNTRQLQLHFLDLKGIRVKVNILCGLELPVDHELVDADGILNSNMMIIEDDETDETEEIIETKIYRNKKNARKASKTNDLELHNTKQIKLIQKTGKLATAGRDFIQINPIGSAMFILYGKLLSISRMELDEEERDPKFIHADQETRRELAFNFGEVVSKNDGYLNLFFGIPLYQALEKYIGKEVKVRTDDEFLFGTLIDTREGRIQIQNKKFNREIDIRSICYLKVVNLK
ncbi:hypothetical protein [Ureibacillus acetophenoni]